jgi:hypothetical protein
LVIFLWYVWNTGFEEMREEREETGEYNGVKKETNKINI